MEIDVYCDESHPDLFASNASPFSYMVIGGLWCEKSGRSQLKQEIHGIRDRHRVGGEFKWQKVSESKSDFYQDIIEWFFQKGEAIRFRCIVVDKNRVDLSRYHAGDPELGFYKFYYQLLKHWIKEDNIYSIFVDFKTNRRRDRLAVLGSCLNSSCPGARIETVQAIRSGESVLIQLTDFLAGSVSAILNRSIVGNQAKCEAIRLIESYIGGTIRGTGLWERKFNVFVIQPIGGW